MEALREVSHKTRGPPRSFLWVRRVCSAAARSVPRGRSRSPASHKREIHVRAPLPSPHAPHAPLRTLFRSTRSAMSERQPTLPPSVQRSDHIAVELQPARTGVAEDQHAPSILPQYSAVSLILIILPGALLGTIDQGVVDVSLVTIARDLCTPMHTAQWVSLVYMLVMASTQVIAGRLGDRYSKPRLYEIGLIIFTCSSAGCGLSTSIETLIAMRAVQGLGSAIMGVLSLAMIKCFTKPEETSIAMGYAGSLIGLGISLGPPLGGLMTRAFGWPSVFFINLPVAVLALGMVRCYLPDTPTCPDVSLDPMGSLLIFAAVGGTMYTISASQQQSAELTAAMALGSMLLLAALGLWLRYAARPIVPRAVLASWPIRCGVASACGLYFGVALARFMLPLYLQMAMGWSQAGTGFALMCQPVTLLLVGLVSGRLVKRIGAIAQTALSLLLLAAAVLLLGAGLGSIGLMGGSMVLLATGQSLFNPANQGFVMACATPDQLSLVAALLQMCRSVSLPLGIVCCTTLLSVLSPPMAARTDGNMSGVTSATSSVSSSASPMAIDVSAARSTVWLYLLPTTAAFVITLMRGEPRKATTDASKTTLTATSSGPANSIVNQT